MRAMSEIAKRLWQTRATVKEMQRRRDQGTGQGGQQGGQQGGGLSQVEASRLLVFKSALHTLAWALEIDLDLLDAAPPLAADQYPTEVKAHRVEIESVTGKGARCLWLVEMPAHHDRLDAGFSTEYQAFFLSDDQARDLYAVLGESLPSLDAGDGHGGAQIVCTLPQLRPASRRVIPDPQPTIHLPTQPVTTPAPTPATRPATRPAPKPRPARRPPMARPIPDSDSVVYGDWGA